MKKFFVDHQTSALLQVSQQTLWQLLGKIISVSSTIFILGIITRGYGEEGTGVFTLALAYLAFFFLAADLGLNTYILPRLSTGLKEVNQLFTFRLWWSVALVIVSSVLAFFLPFSNPLFTQSVLIGSLMVVSSSVFSTTSLVFQKKLRFDQLIIGSSVGSLVVIPVVWFITSKGLPVPFLVLGPLLGWIINNLVSLSLVKNFFSIKLVKSSISYPVTTLSTAWPITLTLILNTVYFRLDAFILSSFRSFAEVGIYNFAYQFFQTALVFPTFIMNSFYPLMIHDYQQNPQKFKANLTRAFFILLVLSLIGTILTVLLAPVILPLISGTQGFSGSIEALQILSLSLPAFFLSSLLMWTVILIKKQKSLFFIYLGGLILNGGLNFIFIPQYSFYAASWVTVISEYLILTALLIILIPTIFKKKI